MFSPARPRSFVCSSVYLFARLLKNACMDFDEIVRVDRCRLHTKSRVWRCNCENTTRAPHSIVKNAKAAKYG